MDEPAACRGRNCARQLKKGGGSVMGCPVSCSVPFPTVAPTDTSARSHLQDPSPRKWRTLAAGLCPERRPARPLPPVCMCRHGDTARSSAARRPGGHGSITPAAAAASRPPAPACLAACLAAAPTAPAAAAAADRRRTIWRMMREGRWCGSTPPARARWTAAARTPLDPWCARPSSCTAPHRAPCPVRTIQSWQPHRRCTQPAPPPATPAGPAGGGLHAARV